MGDIVQGPYPTRKPTFTLDQTAANNTDLVTNVSPNACAIVVSDTVDRSRQMEIVNAILMCSEVLREQGFPQADSGVTLVAASVPVGAGRGSVTTATGATAIANGSVGVAYTNFFIQSNRPAGIDSLLFQTHIRRLTERWIELVGKSLSSS